MVYARRFNDLIGLGYEGYPVLLALALLAWHEKRGARRSARSILEEILVGSTWFKKKVAEETVWCLDSRGYLEFACQDFRWRPGGWRRCPRDWRVTQRGYARLQELLQNIGLTVEDVLKQPSPIEVKNLIDGRIREVYREHWARVKHYEEVAGNVQQVCVGCRHNPETRGR
jgi:hypothetical protein